MAYFGRGWYPTAVFFELPLTFHYLTWLRGPTSYAVAEVKITACLCDVDMGTSMALSETRPHHSPEGRISCNNAYVKLDMTADFTILSSSSFHLPPAVLFSQVTRTTQSPPLPALKDNNPFFTVASRPHHLSHDPRRHARCLMHVAPCILGLGPGII